ncbi:hypothetical protein HMPREF1607_00380 [Escherichia coli 908524]|nr:hypothetical protein HMPREF1607_00380 [Escherichia coli 908524]
MTIQWLTTAHKTPCVWGDGSRSGPSPCQGSVATTPSLEKEKGLAVMSVKLW